MTQTNIDVVGIGNAIVDVIAHTDDAFLAREALVKGTMTLIDAERADAEAGLDAIAALPMDHPPERPFQTFYASARQVDDAALSPS